MEENDTIARMLEGNKKLFLSGPKLSETNTELCTNDDAAEDTGPSPHLPDSMRHHRSLTHQGSGKACIPGCICCMASVMNEMYSKGNRIRDGWESTNDN